MTKPWWIVLIQSALWFAVMAWIMKALANARSRPRPVGEERFLVPPLGILALGIMCAFLCAGAIALPFFSDEEGVIKPAVVLILIFGPGAVAMLGEYYWARHELLPAGVRFGSMFGRRGEIKWNEVARVSYARHLKWIRVEAKDGRVARFSTLLVGLQLLCQQIVQYVPREAIDRESLQVLRDAAAGQLPPIWQ